MLSSRLITHDSSRALYRELFGGLSSNNDGCFSEYSVNGLTTRLREATPGVPSPYTASHSPYKHP